MRRGLVGAALIALLMSSCSATGDAPAADFPACGPPAYADIRGNEPSYLSGPLDDFPVARSLCEGLWIPRSERNFVPQGLAIDGRAAIVSGYDGGGPPGTKYCRLLRMDLKTGRLL